MAARNAVFSNLSSRSQEYAFSKSDAEATNMQRKRLVQASSADDDLAPFTLRWSFGINPEAPVINLTTKDRTLLAYACSHVAVIYDYASRKMTSLQGHRNPVTTLSATRDGKWLLTADSGNDCRVMIWNIDRRIPVCTLFRPHGSEGMTAASISPDAKQIVTVGNGKCQNVHFWLFNQKDRTHGKDTPDASVSLIDTSAERVKEIIFNDEHPEQFALTTDYHVLFLSWNGHALRYNCPKVMAKARRAGIFNGSCYASAVQQAFTATTNGYILVWTDVSRENERAVDDLNNERQKHTKTVSLQNCNITVITTTNKDMLVTGNSSGRITFYDYQLKLLYWCQSCELDSIRWISFALHPDVPLDLKSEYDCQSDDKIKVAASSFTLDVNMGQNYRCDKSTGKMAKEATKYSPVDATLQSFPFNVQSFLACSVAGVTALIEISRRKCDLVLRHAVAAATSIDTHPESNYVIVGDAQGRVYLYDYEELILTVSRSMPPLPNFQSILEKQAINENIVYVTCPHSHESLRAVTALKFSPRCDMLLCGLENGAIWMLHHVTLEVLDETPYKHSSAAINKIAFAQCAEYMAYADNALTVVVFKRNDAASATTHNVWNLLGKYHSHYLPVREILFGPAVSDHEAPRLFSLGDDRELVEYDLPHSGPYPAPGLKILRINRIEQSAVPLCLAYYPQSSTERFLVIANSEYKYKIFDEATMTIRGTYLGPTFEEPVQQLQILTDKLVDDKSYMVFITNREMGLQLLPLDGNPYKIISMMAHPEKITGISVSKSDQTVFTIGYNDPCVLMWKIRQRLLKSVDVTVQLGGEGLSPFHCLIEGEKDGWLINEMKDLFYYAQILHQGENTTAARIISDTIVVEQIPNLMRAIGYYPTNEEIENIMAEVCYKHYVETGRLVDQVTFEEFVRLYVNHRPAFEVSVRQVKEAFCAFAKENFSSMESPSLTREQFMDVLFGEAISGALRQDKLLGEPLTLQEAYRHLRLLTSSGEEALEEAHRPSTSQRSVSFDFRFLPTRISYKDFIVDIMGVELKKST